MIGWLFVAALSTAGVVMAHHLHVVARRWDDDPKTPAGTGEHLCPRAAARSRLVPAQRKVT